MGETREEVSEALRQLHDAGCELITITQYLRPSVRHHPVERWVKPHEFVELKEEAEQIGFSGVMSGPLVRSSYRAGRLYQMAIEKRAASSPPRRSHYAERRPCDLRDERCPPRAVARECHRPRVNSRTSNSPATTAAFNAVLTVSQLGRPSGPRREARPAHQGFIGV